MKFFVTTVIEKRNDYEIAGDVFYIDENIVKVAGIEHYLHYGDIVCHGNLNYYINDNDVSIKEHDNTFYDFWDLENGLMPDDGKRYFVVVNENTSFSDEMKSYLALNGKIVSRNEIGLTLYPLSGPKIYQESKNKAIIHDGFIDISHESNKLFYDAVRALNESRKNEIIEDETFVDLLSEKASQLIDKPLDGKDGKNGIDGKDGKDGIDGKDGKAGAQGNPGQVGKSAKPGLPGKTGLQGKKGEPGNTGARGRDGKDGKDGIDGKDGLIGEQGPKGDTGERGEKGEAGIILTEEQNTVIAENLRKEFEQFRKIDGLYKQRLNTQLGSLGGGGSDSLMENRDVQYVDRSNLSNGQFLVYDTSADKFVLTDIDGLYGGANSDSTYPIYIQNTAPVTTADKYMWIQTEINGNSNSFSFWFDDGC